MKFLHIILPSKRMMNTYVKMIRDHFDKEEHAFLFLNRCVTPEDRKLFAYGNMLEIPQTKNRIRQVWELYKILRSYDCIIWHGMIYDWKKALTIFLLQRQLKKSVWIIRGIDLYNYRMMGNSTISKALNYINYRIRKMVPRVVTIFPTDEAVYHEEFGYDSQCFQAFYPIGAESFEEMDHMAYGRSRENGKIWILNGNNAYTFNRHIEALQKLLKFRRKKIDIIVPLSYGNDWINSAKNYKQSIRDFLEENFTGKFHILLGLMPVEQYNEMLANIDVAIINSNRQNALGNILRLLYTGCKVYLAKDNPVYDYFRSQGVPVHAVEDIDNEDFEQFVFNKYSNEAAVWIKENFHPDFNVQQWRHLFDALSEEKSKVESNEIERPKNALRKAEKTGSNEIYGMYRKRNYLFLRKYISGRRSFNDYKDLIIVGSKALSINMMRPVFRQCTWDNSRYIFKGFLDMDDDKSFPEDYLGCYNTYAFQPSDCCICGIDEPETRRRVMIELVEKGVNFIEYRENECQIGEAVQFGQSNVILGKTVIEAYCQIGYFCLFQDCLIKSHVRIEDYVVIKTNAIVGANAYIGEGCIINEDAVIETGAVLQRNTVVAAGSVVRA